MLGIKVDFAYKIDEGCGVLFTSQLVKSFYNIIFKIYLLLFLVISVKRMYLFYLKRKCEASRGAGAQSVPVNRLVVGSIEKKISFTLYLAKSRVGREKLV